MQFCKKFSMVNNIILIGTIIGVFFVGIGISYGIFSSSQVMPSSMMMTPQQMNQMMHDPDFRNEVMEFMIQDTEHMNQWMLEDPQHISLMIEKMKVNHDFMMGMTLPMIQDPGLRLQILGHMTESPEAMIQMQQMMGGMMDDGSMDHDETAGHDETADHDEATMGMLAPPQTYIVSLAKGSGVPGCELTDECYLPYSLEIWVSDTVSWNNVDSAAHTVTSGHPNKHDGNFDSGIMMVNQSWEFTFTDSGEYDYYCSLHPWMKGTVSVNQKSFEEIKS